MEVDDALKIVKFVLASTLLLFLVVQPLLADTVQNPGSLVIAGDESEPEKLEPATAYETLGGWVLQNTYETLWFYDSGEPDSWAPVLATEMPAVSEDGLNITFTLKNNVYSVSYEPGAEGADSQGFKKWGPLTAEDVKYSLDRTVVVADPGGPAWMYEFVRGATDYMFTDKRGTQAGVLEYIAAGGITVDGPMTVTIHLTEPVFNNYQLYVMMQPWYAVYSEDCIEAHGGIQPGAENQWLMTHTCGTGPYVVTEWTPEDRLVMKANPYWRNFVSGSYPALTTVLWEFTPEVYVRMDQLGFGEVDMAVIPPTHITHFVDTYSRPPKVTFQGMAIYPSPTLVLMQFNMQMDTTKRPTSPFGNQVVRQAFQHLVDKQNIIDMVLKGLGKPADAPIADGLVCFEESKPTTTYSHNTTTARQMLLDAGYNSDNPINLVYGHVSGEITGAIAGVLLKATAESADMFDNEGDQFIFIDVISEQFSWYLESIRAGTTYDIYYMGWIADFPDPDNFIFPYLDARGTFASVVGFNDTQINQWIGEAKLQPRPEACSLYQQIQERAAQLSPYIYLYQPLALFLQRDWIEGFYPDSTNPMQYGFGFVWKMSKAITSTTTTTTTTTSTTSTTSTTIPTTTTTVPAWGVDPLVVGLGVAVVALVAVVVLLLRRR